MIGILQIITALLIIAPKTRLIGLALLLPIITNIFLLHLYMHGDMEENIKTGLILVLNLILLLSFKKQIQNLILKNTTEIDKT